MLLDFVIFHLLICLALFFPSLIFLKLHFHRLRIIKSELKYIQLLIPQVNLNYLNGLYFILGFILLVLCGRPPWLVILKTHLGHYSFYQHLSFTTPTKSRQNLLQSVIFFLVGEWDSLLLPTGPPCLPSARLESMTSSERRWLFTVFWVTLARRQH